MNRNISINMYICGVCLHRINAPVTTRPLMLENGTIIIAFSLPPPSFLFRFKPTRYTAHGGGHAPATSGGRRLWNIPSPLIDSVWIRRTAAGAQVAVGPQQQSWADLRTRHTELIRSAYSELPQQEFIGPAIRHHARNLHAAYNHSILDSGNKDKDEHLLTPNKRRQKPDLIRSLVLYLLALEIYIPLTLVACYTFSVASKDVGVHVDVNRVLHGHHIYIYIYI